MGESFVRKRAKKFKHSTDAAYDMLKVPTLLTLMRPDIFNVEYTCQLAQNDICVDVGVHVEIHDEGGSALTVTCGNRIVGHVEMVDSQALREVLGGCGGILSAEVLARSPCANAE